MPFPPVDPMDTQGLGPSGIKKNPWGVPESGIWGGGGRQAGKEKEFG